MDDVTVELEVLQAVGKALARLNDAEAQRRVIRWINDRFQKESVLVTSTTSSTKGTPIEMDRALGVEELEDFFHTPAPARPMIMHRDADAHADGTAQPTRDAELGVDSLVRGFVTDFQRVALEWQGA